MVIKTTKGCFEVLKNVREALNIENFQTAYLEEFFDSYPYIVGDIASNTLRLKGFSNDNKKDNYYKFIPEYLSESCAYRGAYFILRRINDNEYNQLAEKYKKNPNPDITKGEEATFTIVKTPYDKEALELESTQGGNPNIILDMARINAVRSFPLPDDLKEDPKTISENMRRDNRGNRGNNNKPQNNNNNNKPQGNNNNNQQQKSFSNNNNNQRKAFSNNKKKR